MRNRRALIASGSRCRAAWAVLTGSVFAGWLWLAVPLGHASPDPTPTPAPAAAAPARARAKHSAEAVKTELTTVIDGQLAAFRANDFARAYTFASAEIRGMLPAADFETMVRMAYPVIARSVTVDYGLAFDTGEEAVINVRVQNAEKQSVQYQYLLKKENGAWKISGVAELKPEGLSV